MLPTTSTIELTETPIDLTPAENTYEKVSEEDIQRLKTVIGENYRCSAPKEFETILKEMSPEFINNLTQGQIFARAQQRQYRTQSHRKETNYKDPVGFMFTYERAESGYVTYTGGMTDWIDELQAIAFIKKYYEGGVEVNDSTRMHFTLMEKMIKVRNGTSSYNPDQIDVLQRALNAINFDDTMAAKMQNVLDVINNETTERYRIQQEIAQIERKYGVNKKDLAHFPPKVQVAREIYQKLSMLHGELSHLESMSKAWLINAVKSLRRRPVKTEEA